MKATIEELLKLVYSVSILDLCLYYFIAYLALMDIQRILLFNVETKDKFETNPKVLASIIIIFCYTYIKVVVSDTFDLTTIRVYMYSLAILIFSIFIIIKLYHKLLLPFIFFTQGKLRAKNVVKTRMKVDKGEVTYNQDEVKKHSLHIMDKAKLDSENILIDIALSIIVILSLSKYDLTIVIIGLYLTIRQLQVRFKEYRNNHLRKVSFSNKWLIHDPK